MTTKFWDGRAYTRVSTEPDGRIAIEGYDGEQLVHRATYSKETAALIAKVLIDAAEEAQ